MPFNTKKIRLWLNITWIFLLPTHLFAESLVPVWAEGGAQVLRLPPAPPPPLTHGVLESLDQALATTPLLLNSQHVSSFRPCGSAHIFMLVQIQPFF